MTGMGAAWLAAALLAGASAAQETDFGVRTVPGEAPAMQRVAPSTKPLPAQSSFNLASAANLGFKWGRVTSTRRSAARNRAVGGVANSFHLSGRAIDIARRPGVRHADIDAAFRRAGYHIIESLDEGDHSHFAFGTGTPVRKAARQSSGTATAQASAPSTGWRIVSAPGAASR